MRVVKCGPAWEKPWTTRVTCRRCQSEVEVEAEDVFYREGDRPGEGGAYLAVCGVCRSDVFLPPDRIRQDVRDRAGRR